MTRYTSPRLASDIMNTKIITARPDMSSEELQELLVMNRISGAPVVDAQNRLVGVISMSDLLNAGTNLPYSIGYFESARLDLLLEEEGFHLENLSAGYAADLMTRHVVTASPDTRIEELAEMMYNNHIHRVIITEPAAHTVLGIVTTFDLLRLIAGGVLERPENSPASPAKCGQPAGVK